MVEEIPSRFVYKEKQISEPRQIEQNLDYNYTIPDWFGNKFNSVWYQIIGKVSVIKIQIWFDLKDRERIFWVLYIIVPQTIIFFTSHIENKISHLSVKLYT